LQFPVGLTSASGTKQTSYLLKASRLVTKIRVKLYVGTGLFF